MAKSVASSAFSDSTRAKSISFLILRISARISFSVFHFISKSDVVSRISAISFAISLRRTLLSLARSLSSLLSRFKASVSISRRVIFRCTSSSCEGLFSSEIFNIEAASSIRSTALSGRNRFVIYLVDKFTAAIIASSVIRTPWNNSYLDLSPRIIAIASSSEDSFTYTGWNRRASAGSFSKCFWNSFNVVAPIARNSPRASAGFNIFAASCAPSPPPVPIKV